MTHRSGIGPWPVLTMYPRSPSRVVALAKPIAQRGRWVGSATKANALSVGESIEIVWVLDRTGTSSVTATPVRVALGRFRRPRQPH